MYVYIYIYTYIYIYIYIYVYIYNAEQITYFDCALKEENVFVFCTRLHSDTKTYLAKKITERKPKLVQRLRNRDKILSIHLNTIHCLVRAPLTKIPPLE